MRKPPSGAPGAFHNKGLKFGAMRARAPAYARSLIILFASICIFLPQVHAEIYEASHTPWSGYWWPFTEGGLATGLDYRGHPAPLEKYELLTLGEYPGDLVSWYKGIFYDPAAPAWYGLCGAFASAACYEHIEILPSSEDNIVFRVGDKKGLLTLAHNNDIMETADGSRPEVFHYWLLTYIKDQAKAFVADLDPGEEVWSYPIYRYDMEGTVDDDRESVTVTVWYADDFVSPDYRGTKALTGIYTYDLFLDEEGAITGGEWTGQSTDDHPDGLLFTLIPRTSCPYLDYEEAVRLAESRDDFLERPGEVVDLAPGTYNLILLDEDIYSIGDVAGDTVSIYVEKQEGSSEDILVEVIDGKGEPVSSAIVDLADPMHLLTTVEDPPCMVRLSQEDYSDPNIYTLEVDLVKAFNQKIPYVPKHGMWSGFALTNPNDTEVTGVALTTYTQEGQPLQTVLGPLSLFPGEKRLFLFDDLSWRQRELSDIDKLVLMSDGDINFLNLFGYAQDSLACFVQGRARGSHFIIPDTVPPMMPDRAMFGGVENESFQEAYVSLSLYARDGVLVKESSEVIDPREAFPIKPGFYPFYDMPDSGWIEVIGEQGIVLSGYQYTDRNGMTESLFGLPVNSSRKIVPHIPPPGYWVTTVTVINPNDVENRVDFHLKLAGDDRENDMTIVLDPREKRSLELQDQFGRIEGDPLYHSILEIDGEYSVAGYYTYASPHDGASLPLLEQGDFKEELVLPHYPGNDGFWWTGVGICNPSPSATTVRVEPYDGSGDLMEGIVAYLSLDAGAYEVFTVVSLFGENASEISFIKFRTQEASGVIGGFYLYGNRSNEMLSGANM
jgi:hypothetical protein